MFDLINQTFMHMLMHSTMTNAKTTMSLKFTSLS